LEIPKLFFGLHCVFLPVPSWLKFFITNLPAGRQVLLKEKGSNDNEFPLLEERAG
jgi:hypothetical protein